MPGETNARQLKKARTLKCVRLKDYGSIDRPTEEKRQGTAALHDAVARSKPVLIPQGFGVRQSLPLSFLRTCRSGRQF
jgi:hypothetical protein